MVAASQIICGFINIMWSVMDIQSPVAALSLDAEKVFDMVEWGCLFKILKICGFGNKK